MFDILSIAGSGMNAQNVRLNTIASNMANADSISSSAKDTYRAKVPKFETIMARMGTPPGSIPAGGVRVKEIVEDQSELKAEYNPNHPMANEQGYIYRPNVDTVEEMANMLSASRSYEMNIEVISTTKQLLMRTIQLGTGS
jgi:flagellar basal-body rod protein FlgC